MKLYIAFLKKELLESVRTYKLFIMLIVFTIFGIINPLIAKLLPEIFQNIMTDGISITLPSPTVFDAWTQFYKNAAQMGMIVMVIVFSNILAAELSKGTLIIMLTKGLSRGAVILSKYTCMVLIWTISIALCFGLTFGYTCYLFPGEETANLVFSVFCLWLFGVFLLTLLIFASILANNNYGSLLITGTGIVACTLINIFPAAHKYNPLSLTTDNMKLITNTVPVSSLYPALLTAALLSLLLITASVVLFRKKML